MTLGEKIKSARLHAGLTQQDLADRLLVSRQAITKWETDAGIPDVANLKALAALFDVSVDYLLAGDEPVSGSVIRQPINLDDYTKQPPQRDRYDAAVRAHYPQAVMIQPLWRKRKMTLWENAIDFVVQPGVIQAADSVARIAGQYVVDLGNRQLLVKVTKEFIESRELTEPWDGRKLVIDSDVYRKVPYRI